MSTPATVESRSLLGRIRSSLGFGAPSSPLMRIQNRLNPLDAIEHQRLLIRHKDYEPIGQLHQIMFGEGCLPNPAPDNPYVGQWTADNRPQAPMFDWCKTGTLLARARIAGAPLDEYLIVGKLPHPPDLPDRNWAGPQIYQGGKSILEYEYKDGIPFPKNMPKAPMVRQSLLNCAYVPPGVNWEKRNGKYVPMGEYFYPGPKGEEWLIFQPVSQVVFDPFDGVFGVISSKPDRNGNEWTFLYDRKSEEGHLIYGRQLEDRFE